MEERVEISILLDFYGELLTDKQKDIMTLYYNEDLSLGEIAELNNTSRQAIHDTIKRCQKSLMDYETKLGIRYRNDKASETRNFILEKSKEIKNNIKDTEKVLVFIEDIEKELIENL